MFRRRLCEVLKNHPEIPGIKECFGVVVVGLGKSAQIESVNPWGLDEDDALASLDEWLVNKDDWGTCNSPFSATVDAVATNFMKWVCGQASLYQNAKYTAVFIGHPDGAASLSGTPEMKASLVKRLEDLVAKRFAD